MRHMEAVFPQQEVSINGMIMSEELCVCELLILVVSFQN